jgi:hypothetical protein
VFRQLEAALLRAEQRWRRGFEAERVEKELATDLERCEKRLGEARDLAQPGPRPRPRWLAQGRDPEGKPDATAGPALQLVLARLDQGLLAKPPDVKKAGEEFLKKSADKLPFPQLAWTAFATLADDPVPGRPKVRFVHDLLDTVREPPFVETLLLQRLAEWDTRKWPADAVQRLLRVVRAEGKALAHSPRALSGFGPDFRDAAAKRRDGELLLFAGRPSSWGKANNLFEEAARLYQEINRRADAVEQAHRLYDEALAVLPGYEPYLAARREPDTRAQNDWEAAVRAVGELHELLARPAGAAPPSPKDLRTTVDDLQDGLDKLGRLFRERLKTLIALGQQGRPPDYLEAEALLESPRLRAGDRAALWRARREWGVRLHEGALAAEQAEEKGARAPAVPEPDEGAAGATGREHAARRARLSLQLLKLAGLPGLEKLEGEVDRLARQGPDSAWQPLGEQLRAAWVERLPERLRGEHDPARADRLVRVLPPEEDAGQNPAAELRRQETSAFWRWLGNYYWSESEAGSLTGQEVYREFYRDAAEEYLRLSR